MSDINRRTLLGLSGSGVAAIFAGYLSSKSEAISTSPNDSATEASTDQAGPKEQALNLFKLLNKGSYRQAHEQFGSDMANQVNPNQLRQIWNGLEKQKGKFRSVTDLEVINQNGNEIVTGTIRFEHGQNKFIITFRDDVIIGFQIREATTDWSPPPYANESTFTERNVSIQTGNSCSLGATLTVPKDVNQAPGVIIVHGQGPSDRDGTIGSNKPYTDLAWGLASHGIAVLRYEKRTQVCSPNLAEITIDKAVINDALAAIETLRQSPIVTDEEIFVVGHSIGATLAPRIASRDGNVAGIGMLAPLARSAADAIIDQNQYLVNRDGVVTDTEKQQLDQIHKITDQIRSLEFPDDQIVYLGGDEYWGSLQEYDSLETAKCVTVPQLILQGGRDFQVTIEEDFTQWQQALSDKSNVSFERYSKLNHLFMPGTGKPGLEEYTQKNHVARQVITDLSSFIMGVDPN